MPTLPFIFAFIIPGDHSSIVELTDSLPYGHQFNIDYSLPLDLRVSVIKYLQTSDIRALMRSCKSNLYSCNVFINALLSEKFSYLLKASDVIKLDHLLQIPLVNSIKSNASSMIFKFDEDMRRGIVNQTDESPSAYIGIDNVTTNAFITFWLQKMETDSGRTLVITIVFNETNIESIYVSQQIIVWPLEYLFFGRAFKVKSLFYKNSSLSDVKAIEDLMLNGKIDSILNVSYEWCLRDRWTSFMEEKKDRLKFPFRKWIFACVCLTVVPIVGMLVIFLSR